MASSEAAGQVLEDAQPESLSDRRVDAIEDDICPRAFHPRSAAVRKETVAGRGELRAGVAFGAFQTSREFQVRKQHLGYASTCQSELPIGSL